MSLDRAATSQRQSAVMIGNESLLIECATLWQKSGHEIATIVTRNPDIDRRSPRHWKTSLGGLSKKHAPDRRRSQQASFCG